MSTGKNQNIGDMWKTFVVGLLQSAQKQGFAVMLLLVGLYFFTERFDACNKEVINAYKEQNEKLILVIEKNTKAIENFSYHLKNEK